MQIVLIESEIHQAIQAWLATIVKIENGTQVEIDLKATRGAEGYQAFVDLTPSKSVAPVTATPVVPSPAVQTPAPTTPSVAVGEPVPATPTTPLGEVAAPGLDESEAAPAVIEPAPVQATPVPIAEPEQVKPRTPRTPAEAIEWANANPVENEAEVAPVEQVELDGEPQVDVVAAPPVEAPVADESQAEETAAEEAEVLVPNAVDPVQVVEQTPVTQVENVVSEPVPEPVTEVVPIAEPSASTQVEDLSPKVVEVEVNGELQTEVTHSDPALPTGVPEPEVTSVPSDAVVTTKEELITDVPANPLEVQAKATDGEAAPVRRSLFQR